MKPRLDHKAPALVLCLAFICCGVASAATAAREAAGRGEDVNVPNEKLLFGAIRWDIWTQEGKKAREHDVKKPQCFKTLQEQMWAKRLPFYAKLISEEPRTVEIFSDSQAVMDQEIAYAKESGLAYWAFYANPPDPHFINTCRELYLKSRHKSDVNFCVIMAGIHCTEERPWTQYIDFALSQVKEPSYQTVAGGRHLVFIFLWDKNTPDVMWGSIEKGREAIKLLREKMVAAGHKNPYLVAMSMEHPNKAGYADRLGLDAVSAYTNFGNPDYPGLAKSDVAWWDAAKGGKQQLILPLSCGHGGPRDNGGDRRQPTPEQFGKHLETAKEWVEKNPETATPRTVLIYAWNEFDEGGYLCPTQGEEPGKRKIDVLRRVAGGSVRKETP